MQLIFIWKSFGILQIISSLFDIGAIYLKNRVTQNWQESKVDAGQPQVFQIYEQDRAMICDEIVGAMIHASKLVWYYTGQIPI